MVGPPDSGCRARSWASTGELAVLTAPDRVAVGEVGAARADDDLRVLHDLLLVGLELRRQRFLEGHGLGRDHVHQRTALEAWKDRAVDDLLVLRLHQDDAATR